MTDNGYGVWPGTTTKGVKFWGHNGFHPYVAAWPQGLLWAEMLNYDNGIAVTAVVNSPIATTKGGAVTTNAYGVTGEYLEGIIQDAFNKSYIK